MSKSKLPVETKSLIGNAALPVQKYLADTIGIVDINAQDDETLWSIAERGEQMEMAGRLITGLANRELSTRVDTQKLAEELRNRRKNRAAFYASIQMLEAFEALPNEASVNSFAQLGFTKFREIMPWAPEERLALANGESVRGLTLDDAVQMPSRELTQQLKEWQAEHDDEMAKLRKRAGDAETKLETANNELDRIRRLNQKIQMEADLPHFALAVRQESMLLTEQMSFALDTLQAAAQEHLLVEIDHPEASKYQPVAAGTMYYALAGIFARIESMMFELAHAYPDHVNAGVHLKHSLNPAELKLFLESRDRLLAVHQAAAHSRDDDRKNNRPGKPGRPRGSKTKAK